MRARTRGLAMRSVIVADLQNTISRDGDTRCDHHRKRIIPNVYDRTYVESESQVS